jgi:transcriptional regulator with GAF, ATPase, and Fis domain
MEDRNGTSIDENDFFRQATLRICGSLDMETAMRQCLQYLSQVMPADHLSLILYDLGLEVVRTVLIASPGEGKQMDRPIPFHIPWKVLAKRDVMNLLLVDRPDQAVVAVRIMNDPALDSVFSGPVLQSFGIVDSSLLVMRLTIEGIYLGNLVLRAAGKGRYSEKHARLLALLCEPFAVALANVLKHQEVLQLKDALAEDNEYLHRKLFYPSDDTIIGADGGLREIMDMVRQVAPLDSQVLLLGETGVGKDVVAHAIHHSSPRRDAPFVKVNCGAIADTLLDSELFGHEKGAFTGAMVQKRGCFERADRGTIFLDEVGELAPSGQVRMLRVLQYKEIQRVGGSTPIPVNVRIIAATNRNLDEMVRTGQFREDLWFRLNVFPIVIPPLRQRKGDAPALVHHFIQRKWRELRLPAPPALAPGAMSQLLAYDWPGNIRELENVLERALILSRGLPLRFEQILGLRAADKPEEPNAKANHSAALDDVVSNHIRGILQHTKGKIHGPEGAARVLRINPSTLRSKMQKLGIPYKRGTHSI